MTDRRSLAAPESEAERVLADKIAAASASGIDWVQIREKDLPAKRLASLIPPTMTSSPRGRDAKGGARLFLNDRLDLALTAGVSGVHLGESSLPVREAKELASRVAGRREFLVGVSCHSQESAKAAQRDGADYIFFGPAFATPSKAVFGLPQGLDRLAKVCEEVTIPVLAIGGISVENAQSCLRAGASGIAAIRLFQDADDLGEMVRVLHSLEF